MAATKIQALWNHPAGPKTSQFTSSFLSVLIILIAVHFWAPTFKWGIVIANILDSSKPPEKLSYPQQTTIIVSGLIWARYGTVIIPKNWNLLSVNLGMAATAAYQLARKIKYDYYSESSDELIRERTEA